jgi:hypothetical protein
MINTLYPGKPDYTGPSSGYFTLLHHQGSLVEWSHSIHERIEYIRTSKPLHERDIRLQHIVYIPQHMLPEKLQKAYAEYKKAKTEYQKAGTERQKADAEWQKANAEWQKAYNKRQKADTEWQKVNTEWQKVYDKRRKANAEWWKLRAECEWRKTDADKILSYLHKHVPDCKWNGKKLSFS